MSTKLLMKGGGSLSQDNVLDNVRAERVRAGLTQEQIAEKLGISATSYSYKESGRRQFKVQEFISICNILNLSPEVLIRKPQ